MDRLRSGFHHRKSRKESPSRPTIITDTANTSGKTTPEPAAQQQGQGHSPLHVPGVPAKKASPFRALRDLSRSHKRARSPNAASETNSPVSAISAFSARDSLSERHMTSPHPLSAVETTQAPKMPSFLALSPAEIDAKFQEIVWMERNRVMLGIQNPTPSFRWAHVAGDHRKLDRYMNIQPWENNRVRLRVAPGQQDYVNASPVTLTSVAPTARIRQDTVGDLAGGGGPDQYIAMQGPKHKTTGHVWRMVVEQLESPAVIVMLTETHEGNTEKCYPYFPRTPEDAPLEINRKDEFRDGFRASVRCEAIEETEAGDAIELRKLVVRVYKTPKKEDANGAGPVEDAPAAATLVDENGDVKMLSPVKDTPDEDGTDGNDTSSETVETGRASSDQETSSQKALKDGLPEQEFEERVVWHFLYKLWPDFGVPALEDLESFFTLMRLSREKNANSSNPRIVHCSAGVGRSGTFIALEHLMREMDAGVLDHWDAKAARWPPRQKRHLNVEDNDAASTEGLNGHLYEDHVEEEHDADAALKMDVEEGTHDKDDDDDQVVTGAVEPDDLIFHTVNQLREQRRSMVQAESQYLFLYQVLRKLWEDRHGTSTAQQHASGVSSSSSHYITPVSEHPPRLHTPDGEPAAKRLEFDPFVEQE